MKGSAGQVLYLDFDGVLHHENVLWYPRRGPHLKAPEGFTLFQHAELLEQLLEPYPDVKIVLSTNWVVRYGCTKAAKKLPPALRERVVGATFHSKMREEDFVEAPRGMQVWGDVVQRKPQAWLALDDAWLQWPKWCIGHYVRTHEQLGISDPDTLNAVRSKLWQIFGSRT
jgi:hypothetical protein